MTALAVYDSDAEAKQLASSLFTILDLDKSGAISMSELANAVVIMQPRSSMTVSMMPVDADSLSVADTNRDGSVDEAEWHTFMGTLYAVLGQREFLLLAKGWVSNKDKAGTDTPANAKSAAKKANNGRKSVTKAKGAAAKGADNALTEEAATLKIQSVARGKSARKEVDEKKGKSEDKRAAKEGVAEITPPDKPTTVAELWDLIALHNGQIRTQVDVEEIAHLFLNCRRCGLNLHMVDQIHMHFDEDIEPEDLYPGEIGHICKLLILDPEVSEEAIRHDIADIKYQHRTPNRENWGLITNTEDVIGLKRFRKLITHISNLMRIDQEYIIAAFAYEFHGSLEMPPTLAALLREQFLSPVKKGQFREPDAKEPDHAVLQQPILMTDFLRFAYKCKLLDSTGTDGLAYEDLIAFFAKVNKNMEKLVQARCVKRKLKVSAKESSLASKAANDGYLSGHCEFTLLLEALVEVPQLRRRFKSPLQMVLDLHEQAEMSNMMEDQIADNLAKAELEYKENYNKHTWK